MQKGRNMKQEFTADRNAGRLDSFLSAETKISRSKIKKYIESNLVSVNNVPCADASRKLLSGDCVRLEIIQEENSLQAAENDLTIIIKTNT